MYQLAVVETPSSDGQEQPTWLSGIDSDNSWAAPALPDLLRSNILAHGAPVLADIYQPTASDYFIVQWGEISPVQSPTIEMGVGADLFEIGGDFNVISDAAFVSIGTVSIGPSDLTIQDLREDSEGLQANVAPDLQSLARSIREGSLEIGPELLTLAEQYVNAPADTRSSEAWAKDLSKQLSEWDD